MRTPIRTILVAVADPARTGQPAVDRAAQLAGALGARVILFHAAFDPALSGRPFFDSKRLARSRGWFVAKQTQRLERLAAPLTRRGLDVDAIVHWEEPAHESILRAVVREQADLVIAACHDPSRDRPPQLRWTDWELMRLCSRPLLLMTRASGVRRRGPVLAALDPTHAHDKPASLDIAIARYACALAAALETDCQALHCLQAASRQNGGTSAGRPRSSRQQMQSKLRRVLEASGSRSARVHLQTGSVAERVVALADDLDAQVLAMGIVSRRGLKRLLIGDSAEAVIRRVACDLLLVKPKGFKLRLGRSRKEPISLPAQLVR